MNAFIYTRTMKNGKVNSVGGLGNKTEGQKKRRVAVKTARRILFAGQMKRQQNGDVFVWL